MSESKFKIRTKRISLGFLGKAWEDADAYIESRFLSIPDSRIIQKKVATVGDDDTKAIEEMSSVISQLFVSGKTLAHDGTLVDLAADDIELAFDALAMLELYGRVLGNPDPKASQPSTTTTPVEATSQPSV